MLVLLGCVERKNVKVKGIVSIWGISIYRGKGYSSLFPPGLEKILKNLQKGLDIVTQVCYFSITQRARRSATPPTGGEQNAINNNVPHRKICDND